eukprot:COSAG01_NODE_7408_length_3210_cov_40.721706_2_plen_57_part_00
MVPETVLVAADFQFASWWALWPCEMQWHTLKRRYARAPIAVILTRGDIQKTTGMVA